MKFKIQAIYLWLIIAALIINLSGCGNSNNELSSTFSSSATNTSTSAQTTLSSGDLSENPLENSSIEKLRQEYKISLPIKKATDIFDITKIEIPEKINGNNVSIFGIIDNDTFLIVLYDDENSITDTGFLRLSDNSYTSFKEIGDNFALCTYNDKYIVYKVYDGDFTKKAEDESVKLFIFDISSKESKLIFTYSFDRELELSHYINNIVLTKDSVYFDDITNNYQQAILYKYDIKAQTVSEVIKDAQNPFLLNNDIIFMRLKDGDYHNMSSLSGEFDFDMDFNSSDIRVGNSIISIDTISSDDDLKETTRGLNDWDYYSSNNHEYVLTTTRTIGGLVCGGDFAAFTDYNDGVCPVIYNSKTEEFIAFDEIDESVWWLLNDNYGILTTSKEHYLFSTKASYTENIIVDTISSSDEIVKCFEREGEKS